MGLTATGHIGDPAEEVSVSTRSICIGNQHVKQTVVMGLKRVILIGGIMYNADNEHGSYELEV